MVNTSQAVPENIYIFIEFCGLLSLIRNTVEVFRGHLHNVNTMNDGKWKRERDQDVFLTASALTYVRGHE